jgi:uncharacterized membrane protein (UPF0182 family)
MSRARRRILGTIAIIVLIGIPILTWFARFWTDYRWFEVLGQEDVFITRIVSQIAVGAAFAVATFLIVFINLRVARAMAPKAILTSVGDDLNPQLEEFIVQVRSKSGPILDKLVFVGSLAIAVLVGLSLSSQWDVIRLALAQVPFGQTDPQFGLDIGFYVFVLPALRIATDWLFGILIVTLIATAAVDLIDGAIQPRARFKGFAPHVKAHISVLLGLIVASRAFDYYLSMFELNFSPRGQVTGASFTDVNAQLPALRILIVIAIVSAVILLVNIRVRGWRLPIIALGVWIAASILIGGIYPALIQQFRVRPNEIAAEEPYIERNIMATREAFGLADIETRDFPATEDLTAQDVIDNRDTLENVRLWDPAIIEQSYRQLQIIRPYYDFTDVDVDRYEVEDDRRQILISARELDVGQLAEQAQTWVNQHLVYTHGYGIVMSPVNESDPRGLPNFIVQDIPPISSAEIVIDQPSVYFGELTNEYIVVKTETPEFDFPLGDQNAETIYEGEGGVQVGGLLGKLLFAIRFGTAQILFSDAIGAESEVLFDRNIITRVEKLAPWLWLDDDPYAALVDGRLVWILDGYTWSDDYPYSEPLGQLSYIRNSVKITIDALDGTTTLYAFDADEPVLEAWRSIFPGLLVEGSEVPDAVAQHFRYPEDLFRIQAEVYKEYHMTDPKVFYNKEDSWELPGERSEQGTMDPYYVLMRLPGDTSEDFQMIIPFTPRNRDNMIGWMSAKSDPGSYGERVVYEFPKDRVILGPEQVSARINQDETISPQLTLWSQRGSQVILGNMLVIPLEDSIVYIQPLYLQAEQTAIPELTRVIVVYADKVEMAPDLESALLQVFGERPPQETDAPEDELDGIADAATARDLYEQAIEAQTAGDWAEYGRLIEELGRVLGELAGVPSEAATETPTETP